MGCFNGLIRFNGFGLNEVGVGNTVWTSGTWFAANITVWIDRDVAELSLGRTVSIFNGSVFWINVAREGEISMFPVPVLKCDKIEPRCIVVVAVTVFFTFALETCIIVSLFQALPSEYTLRRVGNIPRQEVPETPSTCRIAKIEPNLTADREVM